MKKLVLLLLPFSLTGCLQMFAAKPVPLGDNTYNILAQGNAFASKNVLSNKITKAANKACPNGYTEKSDQEYNVKYEQTYNAAIGFMPVPVKNMTKIIQCNR